MAKPSLLDLVAEIIRTRLSGDETPGDCDGAALERLLERAQYDPRDAVIISSRNSLLQTYLACGVRSACHAASAGRVVRTVGPQAL